MFTNSLLAGGLGAAYLTVLVLQLNPHVPLLSSTTWRWFVTLALFYGLHLAIACYVLLVVREFFSIDALSPGWASVRVLAWLAAIGAAVAAALMWLNANAFRLLLGEIAAWRMMAGALATTACALVLLAIALVHYTTGRRRSTVGAWLFALAVMGSLTLPLAARGRAVPVAAPASTPAVPPGASGLNPRLLLLLLDGASLEYIRTRTAQGRLPNFSKLLESGASMYLATIRPTQPVPVWAAVATGMYPAKNGVRSSAVYFARGDTRALYLLPDHCFSHALVRFGAIRTELSSSRAWAVRPLWSILYGAGLSTGLVRWPLTYPAPPTLGFVLTDRFHELLGSQVEVDDGAAYPHDALADAREAFSRGADASPSAAGDASAAGVRDRQYGEAMRQLSARRDARVLALRLESLDAAGHAHYEDDEPALFSETGEAGRRERVLHLDRAYANVDAEVGAALQSLAPGDLLLVISGFGMQRLHPAKEVLARLFGDPARPGTHERAPDGFLAAYGTHVQPGRLPRGSIVDVTPTILYFLGLPVGSDMDGFVRSDLFTPAFTAERPIAFIASHGR